MVNAPRWVAGAEGCRWVGYRRCGLLGCGQRVEMAETRGFRGGSVLAGWGGFVMVDWVWMRMGLQRCVAVTMLARPEVELLPFSLVQVGAPSIGARALPEVHVLPVLLKVNLTRLA